MDDTDVSTGLRELQACHKLICDQQVLIEEYRQQGRDLAERVAELESKLGNEDHLSRAHHYIDHISHEFRTPLSVIIDYLTILRNGFSGSLTHEQRFLLDNISVQATELNGMVDDILDISRLDAGSIVVHRRVVSASDVLQAIEPVLRCKANVRKIEVEIETNSQMPSVFGDAEKMQRAATNIAMNALKYCGSPGRVRIWSEREHDYVRFCVRDNGAGIPATELTDIFKRFHQRNCDQSRSTRGFGLGLSIASELVALNLGTITVNSRVGKGTEFSFTVPVAETPVVLSAYMGMIEQTYSPRERLAVHHLSVTESGDTNFEVADEFLCKSVQRDDLLLPNTDGWTLVARAETAQLTLRRIQHLMGRRFSGTVVTGLPQMSISPARECTVNELSNAIGHDLRHPNPQDAA